MEWNGMEWNGMDRQQLLCSFHSKFMLCFSYYIYSTLGRTILSQNGSGSSGLVTDGPGNYFDNMDCEWLITGRFTCTRVVCIFIFGVLGGKKPKKNPIKIDFNQGLFFFLKKIDYSGYFGWTYNFILCGGNECVET